MTWKKADAGLADLLDAALGSYPVNKKAMFGCPAYFIHGNMVAGVYRDTIFLRLSADDRQALLAQQDEAGLFEPMPGRPMREYATLPESLAGDSAFLGDWLRRACGYTGSLPPKPEKKRK